MRNQGEEAKAELGLLTISETASLLGLSVNQTYNLANLGEIPGAVKLGGRWRVKAAVIHAWLEQDEVSR